MVGQDQTEDLLRDIDETAVQQNLPIHALSKLLGNVKTQYDIIVCKNKQLVFSANNQIQNKLYQLLPALCRAVMSQSDAHVPSKAAKLDPHTLAVYNGTVHFYNYVMSESVIDASNRRPYHDFHQRIITALQNYLPAAPSQKRKLSYFDQQDSRSRSAAEMPSPDMIAAFSKAFTNATQAFLSNSNSLSSRQPQQSSRGGFNRGGARSGGRGGGRGGGPGYGRQQQGPPQRNGRNNQGFSLLPRICENCAEVTNSHNKETCPNLTDPNVGKKVDAHKLKKTEAHKKAQRQNINKKSSGDQPLPAGLNPAHTANMAALHNENDPDAPLYDEYEEDADWCPDHGRGYAAVHGHSQQFPGLHFIVLLLNGLAAAALFAALYMVPQFLGSDLPVPSAFTTVLLANITFLIFALLSDMRTGSSHGLSTVSRSPLVPSQFAIFLLFTCISFAFSGKADGYAFTSQHNLTTDSAHHRCWVDSACTKSIFHSKAMLINVRVLKIPQTVGGIGGSIITAREIGDFPLVLKNKESGKVHLRLIRNVLISPDTGANLLGTNCLNTAGVGFDAPPSFLRSKAKLYIPCRDGTREEFALPKINGLWSVPDSRHVGLAEIPQSAYRAFLQKLLPSDAPRSHQLRALTELEV